MNAKSLLAHYERIADAPDAIARLRRFVLDLAVRGKLVPQNPTDEPASELLRRLNQERGRLEKLKSIRHLKLAYGPISLDGGGFDLPIHWVRATIGQTCDLQTGATPDRNRSDFFGGAIPWLVSGDINRGEIFDCEGRITEAGLANSNCKVLPQNCVLIALNGQGKTRGTVALLRMRAACNQSLVAIIPLLGSDLTPEFVHLSLKARYAAIRELTGKDERRGLNMRLIECFEVPIPPIPEQRRIIAKVNELMALCDRFETARAERETTRDKLTVASLARVNAPHPQAFRDDARFALEVLPALTTRADQIKQLRQTILNLAMRGKLVPQDPTDEPVYEQLARLALARKRLELEGTIRRLGTSATVEEPPFEIPDSWIWCRLPQVVDVVDPNPSHRMPAYLQKGGLPFISSENFDSGDTINFNLGKRVSEATVADQTNRFPILEGAFGFSRIGTIGKTRPLPQIRNYAISHAVCVVNPLSRDDLSMRYLRLAMAVDPILAHAHGGTRSIGVPDLGMGVIRTMAIPLPPLAEQRRIVAKLGELMALCDKLEASLAGADATRRRLLEALLAEALAPAEERELEAAD